MAAQGGEGGVAVLCGGAVNNALESRSSAGGSAESSSERNSPILFFLFFHKAIRSELDALHCSALAYATGKEVDIQSVEERYRFLRLIYHAEDEVIFPALDIQVKNSMEHIGESDLFNHLFELLNSNKQNNKSFPGKLASCSEALQTLINQHLSKEEEQVFPLLIEKFSVEEQASLVWQFFCSIPVNMLKKFLPWLSFSIPSDEFLEMQKCLSRIIPRDDLLQQVVFLRTKGSTGGSGNYNVGSEVQHYAHCNASNEGQVGNQNCACTPSRIGKRKYAVAVNDVIGLDEGHPIDEILQWHNAIGRELEDLTDVARHIELYGDFSNLEAFYERLHLIAEVCIIHSVAEEKVIIPVVDGGVSVLEVENIQKSGDDTTSTGVDLQVFGHQGCRVLVGYQKAYMFLIMLLTLLLDLCYAQPKNIFLLAGQSNMSGHGGSLNLTTPWDRVVPPECEPNPAIFRFTGNPMWEEAHEPLHLGRDKKCHQTCGVGPGMPFANTLLKLQPSMESIGLVPCAISGSALDQWKQGEEYYRNLIDSARASIRGGGVLRALLWYQGESDTDKLEDALSYGKRFEKFVNDLRKDLLSPTLPVIQVALASGRTYMYIVRAQQLGFHIPNVQCVDALGSQLEPDGMHLTTQSQVVLGEKIARTFLIHQY